MFVFSEDILSVVLTYKNEIGRAEKLVYIKKPNKHGRRIDAWHMGFEMGCGA